LTFELLGGAVLVACAWLAVDNLRAREAAIDAARRACAGDGVQLLDDTVMLTSLRIARENGGKPVLRRVYQFEFSDTGDNRLAGAVTLAGPRVVTLYLEPHRAGPPGPQAAEQRPVSS
jgi:hypothetical protein